MSNDRHLNINDGTMGNLFRRVTLATLGLDSMEGVSEQSFEVIERADAFVDRLMGGVSHVMPKVNVERMGMQSTSLADDIYTGMSGLNGPRNATDLGDWQYWLDAVLLTLFDEDEEEAELQAGATSSVVNASRRQAVASTSAAVRQRVAALRASGMRPAMLHSLPAEQKRNLIQELNAKSASGKLETSSLPDVIAETLQQTLKTAAERVHRDNRFSFSESISAFEKIFNRDSRQTFASHMADKASMVSAHLGSSLSGSGLDISKSLDVSQLDGSKRAEVMALAQRWSNSIAHLSAAGNDMESVREMLVSLDGLEKAGAVTHEQAVAMRRAGQSYARKVLSREISNDVSAVAGRIAGMLNRSHATERSFGMLPSHRALSVSAETQQVLSTEALKRSFAALNGRLTAFNDAVSSRVLRDGESAATVRWTRAADRFTRMQGISDEMDRVLLRDVVESAEALGAAGIVSRSLVDSVTSVSQSSGAFGNTEKAIFESASEEQTRDILGHFGATRVLGQLASRVEHSVEKLMQDIAKTGMDGAEFRGFVSDIRQMIATGNGNGAGDLRTSVQASSVIESICAKLDAFADMAATSVVTRGYDELSTEGTYVSTAEPSDESRMSSVAAAQFRSVRQLQQALSTVREQSQKEAKRFVEQHLSSRESSLTREERAILDAVSSAVSVDSLLKAQQVMMPHLDASARQELERTVESVRRSHTHLESVSRQIKLIENTLKLSSNLRQAAKLSGNGYETNGVSTSKAIQDITVSTPKDIRVDDVRVNANYLGALSGTLASYAKIRQEYQVRHADSFADTQAERIERMLSVVKPSVSDSERIQLNVSDNVMAFARQLGSDVSFGYDEIVPDSMSMVRSADMRYPSVAGNDVASVLGHRKAVEMYASELASGKGASVHALSEALQKLVSSDVKYDSIVSYGINDAGERVQLSIGLSNQKRSSQAYTLKQSIGEAYQPSAMRSLQHPSVNASVTLKQSSAPAVSGAEQFVSVVAGVNSAPQGMQETSMALSLEGKEAISGVLARFGMKAVPAEGLAESTSDKLRLTVGGVDFDMSSNAFVQMIAKPVMSSVSHSMPSLMDANNTLYAGYASLIQEHGERRSLKTLRQLYVAELARAGQTSAHSQVGFSTQSFADILGVNPTFVSTSKPARVDSSMETARRQAAEDLAVATSSGMAFSNDIAMHTEAVSGHAFADNSNYSWVSNAVKAHRSSLNGQTSDTVDSHSGKQTQQLLDRIDSMFDYVEGLSERNVGVFSTDETVKVLLEALPAESSLGNKGLPKWRQRDSKAARIAEARELREALAKIGASPVQGTQRFANKQYVSPNLMPSQAAGGAPLFSGGSESGATPNGSANASGYSSDVLNEASIPDEDLQFIAEEVFHRIEESLCEEYQRRRSE